MQSQSVSSCQYGSRTTLRFVLKFDRPLSFPASGGKNSRYKDGTRWICSLAFSPVPYRALQSDRCLVITTRSSLSAPFHGANAGSNPAGDANSMPYGGILYSLFNKTIGNYGLGEH